MNRRQLLRLLGAGAPAMLWPPKARAQDDADGWRFELDGRSRYSLRGRGRTAVDTGEIRVALGNGVSAALGDLEGVRRLRSGGRRGTIWSVVGRFESLEVNAQLTDGAEPWISVRVRGLDEARALDAIHFTDGVTVPHAQAWINGWQSWSPSQVAQLGGAAPLTSHWQIALLGRGGLGLMFGENDAGSGELRLRGRRLDAASVYGGRLVSAVHSPAISVLTFLPSDDPLDALAGTCAGRAGAPQGSLPAGWRSWHAFHEDVTEASLLGTVEWLRAHADPRALRVIELDDGYQRSAGDWGMKATFPGGHEALTARIRAAGFEPALWLAPFAVTERSGIPGEHPEWLVQAPDGGPLVLDHRPSWGGAVHALDASLREVQDWLRALARRATTEWGYSRLVFDYLHYGAAGTRRPGGTSTTESLRQGLRALREGTRNTALVACAAPLQQSLGRADGVRSGDHVRHNWDGVKLAARGVLLRSPLAGRAWVNDPDALVVGEPLTLDEARAWASVVVLMGGVVMASDVVPALAPARWEIIQRALPALSLRARVLDLADARRTPDELPSWIAARVADDAWTVAAVNWGDTRRRLSLNLDTRGVRGPFAAYDAWAHERVADVRGTLSLDVPAHGARVLGLRRPRNYPFVLGSSRHIAQGSVDAGLESWDPGERRLSGKAVMMDGRPYRLAIALPPGRRPVDCAASLPCTMTTDARAVTLDFDATRDDIEWSVQF